MGARVEVVDAVSGFAAVAAAATRDDALAAWEGYERDHRSVFDLYFSEWGDRTTVADALPKVVPVARNALDDLPSLLAVVDAVSRDLVEIFGDAPSTIRIVLLVGVGMSNAWVADFQGAPTAFFALEQMPTSSLNGALIAHELAHIFHAHLRPGTWQEETPGVALVLEGIAIAASRLVCPNLSPPQHLWFDHGYDRWYADCEFARARIWGGLSRDFDQVPAYATYFLLRGEHAATQRGIPIRSGYYAALEIFGTDPKRGIEAARWGIGDAEAYAHGAIARTLACDQAG